MTRRPYLLVPDDQLIQFNNIQVDSRIGGVELPTDGVFFGRKLPSDPTQLNIVGLPKTTGKAGLDIPSKPTPPNRRIGATREDKA